MPISIYNSSSGGGGGSGDVVGAASSTDNAIVRFNGTNGKIIQNSVVIVDDSGNLTTTGTIDGRDVSVDGTKLDGIEAGADVTDATNVAAAGAIMDGDFGTNGIMKRTGVGSYAVAVEDTDYQGVLAEGAFVDGDKTKLDGIQAGAQVNAVSSVNGATGVVVLDADDIDDTATTNKFATAAQLSAVDALGTISTQAANNVAITGGTASLTSVATTDVQATTSAGVIIKNSGGTTVITAGAGVGTGVTFSGDITVSGTVDGRDIATDGTKLDGVETGADVTDPTNVKAALASEVLPIGSGTAGAPSFSFTNDVDTGMYLAAELAVNVIGFSASGARRMSMSAGGLALASGARLNEFSIDGTLGGNSDTAVPTEKAVRTYVSTLNTAIGSAASPAVGCFLLAIQDSGTVRQNGDTLAGSNLEPTSAGGSTASTFVLSGTWTCHGFLPSGGTAANRATLWRRTA